MKSAIGAVSGHVPAKMGCFRCRQALSTADSSSSESKRQTPLDTGKQTSSRWSVLLSSMRQLHLPGLVAGRFCGTNGALLTCGPHARMQHMQRKLRTQLSGDRCRQTVCGPADHHQDTVQSKCAVERLLNKRQEVWPRRLLREKPSRGQRPLLCQMCS